MLLWILVACDEPDPDLRQALSVELRGPPRALAITPLGDLAVGHDGSDGVPTLSMYNPSNGQLVLADEAGPGAPVSDAERTFALGDGVLRAYRGTAVDWQLDLGGVAGAGHRFALSQQGRPVVAVSAPQLAGALVGISQVGIELWRVPLGGAPSGDVVVDGQDVAWLSVDTDDGPALTTVDAETGAPVFTRATALRPIAALDDGALVAHDGVLERWNGAAEVLWSRPIAASSAALDGAGGIWITTAAETLRVRLDDGTLTDQLPVACGPITTDRVGVGWAMCAAEAQGVALHSLDTIAIRRAAVLTGASAIDAPLISGSVVYALADGDAPLLVGYLADSAPAEHGWSRASATTRNDRRYRP